MADHSPATTPNRPPLWEEIDRAWWQLVNTADPHCCPPASDQAACVIRAVRDWLLPEEPEPSFYADGYVPMRLGEERQRLRALLTAEADRAERGDG